MKASWRIRPTRGAVLLVFLALAFLGAASTAGAGWLMVLVAIAVALLIVGMVGPIATMRKPELAIEVPTDGTAGLPLTARLEVFRPRSPSLIEIEELTTRLAVGGTTNADVTVTAPKRGVVRTLSVEVANGSPLGLFWVKRSWIVDLPYPLYVAPVTEPVPVPDSAWASQGTDGFRVSAGDGEIVGGVREYRRGDPVKRIHWVATARYGQLHVREFEHLEHAGLDVVAELVGSEEEQESAAARAAGLAGSALGVGIPVTLHTREEHGPVSALVTNRRDIGRRLAMAVAGPLVASHKANAWQA